MRLELGQVHIAALAGVATLLFALGALFYGLADVIRASRPIQPPPIPGATAAEQRSDVVMRGFTTGRMYRTSHDTMTGDLWLEAAGAVESGKPWVQVKADWAARDLANREAAFARSIAPEILPYLDAAHPDPARRHQAALFMRSFAAGLQDRRN